MNKLGSDKIGWKFEKSESGDVEGLNDGGVETFKDDHLLSLAKESAQNSLDARNEENNPVLLEFNTFYIDSEKFPDVENYREITDLQIEYWKKAKKDKSSENFFKESKEILNSRKIFCLRISDFNTTGLEGSKNGKDNPFSRWFKLVRSKGVTDNDSLAGGSFGLGKFASFACSNLRTVIYSTRDLAGIESHQGVSILASYDTKDGERTKGKGYFCNTQDFSCIDGPFKLDKKFQRDSPGTDIYILGFIEKENELEEKIFSSILRSFLLAIYKGNLIFNLNGKSLEKNNLKKIIEEYRKEIYRSFIPKEIIEYYDILEGNLKSENYNFSMIEKDDIALKIAIGTGLKKRIGMFRNNGMKIFDKRNIRSYNDFSGILLLNGNKVNAYFRKLENPEHDNWEPERYIDDQKGAKDMVKRLFDFITKSLKKLEDNTLPKSENIEGIDSLLDEEFEEEGAKPLEGLDFKPLKVRESKTKRKLKKKIKIIVEGGSEEKGEIKIKTPGGGKGKSGPGEDPNQRAIIKIFPEKIKIFRDSKEEYNLIFSLPEDSSSIKCEIFIGGEDFNEMVELEKASIIKEYKEYELKFKENKIELGPITKDSLNHIKFKLKDDEKWALEVSLYEN